MVCIEVVGIVYARIDTMLSPASPLMHHNLSLQQPMLSVLWATLHQNLEGRRRRGSERRRGMLPPSGQLAQKA